MNYAHTMLDRHHLSIVYQIHKHGTVTKAAETLHLTQSALSHSMRKLETTLGLPIWKKQGRSLRLTLAGMSLLAMAERILPQFEAAEEHLKNIATGKQGQLRIGMECHPCYQWLLKTVTPYLNQYPKVDMDVRQAFKFGGLHALLHHEIDVLVTPDPLYLKSVAYQAMFDYEQVLVVSPEHALANKAYIVEQDLRKEHLITYPIEASRLDIFAQFLTPAGVAVKSHQTLEATEIILKMVSAGRGVTALPKWLIDEYRPNIPLATVRLGPEGLTKTLYLGVRSDDNLPAYIHAFIDIAKQI